MSCEKPFLAIDAIIWVIFRLKCGVATVDIFCLVHSAVRFRGSSQLRWLGLECVSCSKRISYLMSAAAMCWRSWRLTLGCQASWVMSVEVARFGLRVYFQHASHAWCLQLSCVTDLGGWWVWNWGCLPAPAHQPLSSNSLDIRAPEEAYSRNVRASGTLKFGYEGVFKLR